jgi:hypothetical protein
LDPSHFPRLGASGGPSAKVTEVDYTYDALERMLTQRDADAQPIRVTRYAYNAAGFPDTVTDPRGIITKTLEDALGRVTTSILGYNANDTNLPNGLRKTTTQYDGLNHVTSVTTNTTSTSGGAWGSTTNYVYGVTTANGNTINSNDLLFQIQYPGPDAEAEKVTSINSGFLSKTVDVTWMSPFQPPETIPMETRQL